jgi:hypothetical protein
MGPETQKIMKITKPLSIILVFLFVLFQVYLFFVRNFQVLDYPGYINEIPQPLSDEAGKLYKVDQSFRVPGPLARIDIMLGNYMVKPRGGTLQLSIFKGEQCVFLKRYPADRVDDNQFYRFAVDGEKISAGNYVLQLRYFPESKKDRLAVWTGRGNIYPYGEFFVDGKRREGDMTFRVYYLSTLWGQGRRIISEVPSLWGSRVWLAIGVILFLLALNSLFYYFIVTISRPRN